MKSGELSGTEFYTYILNNFNLDGTSARLVSNIITYVENQRFVDQEDNRKHLKSLLDGAFGIEEQEINRVSFY